MNLRTPICDVLEIEVPIFLAGMGGVAHAEVCAAISEAGGYGTLGMATRSPEEILKEMRLALQEMGRKVAIHIRKRRREADQQNAGSPIAEARHRLSPVGLIPVGAPLHPSHLAAVRAQPRAPLATRDLPLEPLPCLRSALGSSSHDVQYRAR